MRPQKGKVDEIQLFRSSLYIYSSYPCSVMDRKRDAAPSWHCFIVYDDEIMLLISELIGKHHDCECYRKDIFDTDFIDDLNREEIDYDSAR